MRDKWYKQSNEQGHVFFDKYIHPDCDLIGMSLKQREQLRGYLLADRSERFNLLCKDRFPRSQKKRGSEGGL